MHAWRSFQQKLGQRIRPDIQALKQKLRGYSNQAKEEEAEWVKPAINFAVLAGAVTLGKALYDSTFAFANYVISNRPNNDITVWGALGDSAFNETLGRSKEIKERYGDHISRGGQLSMTKQETFLDFFVAKFDEMAPLTGSKLRLFEYMHQMELRMTFTGSKKKQGQFVMNVETSDGQWKITQLRAEDDELTIPLEIPHIVALPQQRRSLQNVAAGYPAPPPNLQNPNALAAPHGMPRRPPPPPPDSSNTA